MKTTIGLYGDAVTLARVRERCQMGIATRGVMWLSKGQVAHWVFLFVAQGHLSCV